MTAFDPLRTLGVRSIEQAMGLGGLINFLSKRAPVIVILALLAALLGTWPRVPAMLLDALAIVVGSLAFLLWVARGLPVQFKSREDLGFTRNRDWIAYQIAGKGTPRGYYPLGALGLVTLVLSGFSWLAFAGLMLGVVWGIVNCRYPADQAANR
jgi:hypothetical protein